jgi:hypothetical protein
MSQIATESRKFSALNRIAETNKKGKRSKKCVFRFDLGLRSDYSPRASILGFS